jgi:hypothetical protein
VAQISTIWLPTRVTQIQSETFWRKMNRGKKFLAVVASGLIFSIAGAGQAQANQTINVDLNNFQVTGTDGFGNLGREINGAVAGEVITINVTNSTQGFLGYINDGTGNSININNGAGVNVTNNTGQFYGSGVVSSVVYDGAIAGSYTLSVTLSNSPTFDSANVYEAGVANGTLSPGFALGWLVLDWRQSLVNQANWRSLSILSSGSASLRTGNALRLDTAGATTEKNNVVSCTPGKYTFLNGGSTAETAKIQSYVYTLLVNGKAVSTLSSDSFKSVASHMFPTIAGNMAGTATLDGASWDLKGMSNYSAQCQVYATQSGANIQSVTATAHDSVALAAAAEAAAKVQMAKDMIANWNASNEAAAKKYRDNRLAGKP